MKGLLHVRDSTQLHVLQAVHEIFELRASDCAAGSAGDHTQGQNRIVIIGSNVDVDALLRGALSTVVSD